MLRRRRRRAWRRLAVVLLVLGSGVLLFNPNRRDGWAAVLPNWVLWPVTDWFHDEAAALSANPGSRTDLGRWERLLLARRYHDEIRNLHAKLVALGAPFPEEDLHPSFFTDVDFNFGGMSRYRVSTLHAGKEAVLVVPELGRYLQTTIALQDRTQFNWTIAEIRRIGWADRSTIRTLAEASRDLQYDVRGVAYGALAGVAARSSSSAMGTLVQGLGDSSPQVRLRVVGLLGLLGKDARSALPRLKAMGETDPDPHVRSATYAACAAIETAR